MLYDAVSTTRSKAVDRAYIFSLTSGSFSITSVDAATGSASQIVSF